MTIETKYGIGDKVYTIGSDMKVTSFVVGRISTFTPQDGKTDVKLYDEKSGCLGAGYSEDKCFPTEAELVTYITTPRDAEAL